MSELLVFKDSITLILLILNKLKEQGNDLSSIILNTINIVSPYYPISPVAVSKLASNLLDSLLIYSNS